MTEIYTYMFYIFLEWLSLSNETVYNTVSFHDLKNSMGMGMSISGGMQYFWKLLSICKSAISMNDFQVSTS